MIDRGILIKPTKRKCTISKYKCFDIYDHKGNKIDSGDCDVIDIEIGFKDIMLEIVDGMVHIWSHQKLEVIHSGHSLILELKDKEGQ